MRIRNGILTIAYRGGQGENDSSGVAIAPDGTVYFTTGLALMSLASDGGSVREVLPSDPGDQVFTPKGAVAADGTVYLSGGRLPRIDRVDRDGTATLVAGADEAFRLALTPTNDLLILVEDGRFLYQVGAIARAALVDSVPAPSEVNLDPLVIAASVALTAGMLFLIPFPAEIFNNTLAEHHDQIRAWFRRRRAASSPTF